MVTRRTLLSWVFLATACAGMTMLWLGMRDVMSIGGACGSGATPYVVRQECPSTVWTVPEGILAGAFSVLAFAFTSAKPSLALLAWPALFISLGWNFLEFAITDPRHGIVWGWFVCGVVFVAMGLGPWALARSIPGGATPQLPARMNERINKDLMRHYRNELEELERLHRSGVLTRQEYDVRRAKYPASALRPPGLSPAMAVGYVVVAALGVGSTALLWQHWT